MNALEYLEAEDLTADMVRAWLRAKGWEHDGAGDLAGEECWVRDGGAQGTVYLGKDTPKPLARTIDCLRVWTGRPSQSLLNEINPRMRAGWPTDEELERHAFWMVRTLSDDGIRVLGAYVAREWRRAGIKVECWPCDAHGNKVRRGA